jgi:predicted regulator of Ras-like GTPase activity (Roadblock/LC7/MglB family)
MADLATIARIPNVASAVLGDTSGGFHDAIREPDGEAVASVAAFVTTSLAQAGEELGLGGLRRVVVAGEKRAFLVAAAGGALVTARVEPPSALANVERAFDASIGKGG